MSTVNFSDTTPAAPANYANLKWQSDASGNISAYPTGGAWQTYTPTFGAFGSMTVSGISVTDATYLRSGPIIFVHVAASFTLGGTLSSAVYISVPTALAGANQGYPTLIILGGVQEFGNVNFANATTFQVVRLNGTNFTASGCNIDFTVSYRCA